MNIRIKLLLVFIASFFMSIAAICIVQVYIASTSTKDSFQHQAVGQLLRLEERINVFLDPGKMAVNYVASNDIVKNSQGKLSSYTKLDKQTGIDINSFSDTEKEVYSKLFNTISVNTNFIAVYIGMANGEFTEVPATDIFDPPGYDPRTRPWYTEALKKPQNINISNPYLGIDNTTECTVTAKVYNAKNELVGIVGVDYALKDLTTSLEHTLVGKTGYILGVDAFGNILVDGENKKESSSDSKVRNIKDIPELEKVFSSASEAYDITLNGKERYVIVHKLLDLNWQLAVVYDKSEISEITNSLLLTTLITSLLVAAAAIVLVAFVARSIVQPIEKLVVASQIIASGEYETSDIKNDQLNSLLNIKNNDETGKLADSLTGMVQTLRERFAIVRQKSEEAEEQSRRAHSAQTETENLLLLAEDKNETLNGIAHDLGQVIDALTKATATMGEQIALAEQKAVRQNGRSLEVATATEEMSASAAEVARITEQTAQNAEEAQSKGQEGAAVVNTVVDEVQNMNTLAKDLHDNLNNLGHRVEAIGEVITVITDIADQTNLLALNAAIEAARAGDAGRGFAVVADEVRKLAEKTMIATKEVSDVVHSIQSETRSNIESVDLVSTASERSAAMTVKAGETIRAIVDNINITAQQMQVIANSSGQQTVAIIAISSGTEEVSLMASEVESMMRSCTNLVSEINNIENRLMELRELLIQG